MNADPRFDRSEIPRTSRDPRASIAQNGANLGPVDLKSRGTWTGRNRRYDIFHLCVICIANSAGCLSVHASAAINFRSGVVAAFFAEAKRRCENFERRTSNNRVRLQEAIATRLGMGSDVRVFSLNAPPRCRCQGGCSA